MIPYRKGEKWGFCDVKKQIVVPCTYERVDPFYNGFAEVSTGYDKIGIIDSKGSVIVPCIYKSVSLVKDLNFFVVQDRDSKYGLYRIDQLIFDVVYDAIVFYSEDRIAINKDGIWRIANAKGAFVDFGEDLRSYKKPKPDQVRLVPRYLSDRIFVHNYFGAHVFVDGKKKVTIDTNEEFNVLNTKNKTIYYSSRYEERSRETEFIGFEFYDDQFDVIKPCSELRSIHRVISGNDNSDFIVVEDDKYQSHVLDEYFNYLKKLDYRVLSSFHDERAIVQVFEGGKNRYGYVSPTFEVVVEPIYDDASNFKNGLARVKRNDKYGLIDAQGKVIIPFSYYRIGTVSDGKCAVTLTPNLANSCCFINLSNKIISDTGYTFYYNGPYFNEKWGIAVVNRTGTGNGLIDSNGNEVLKCNYLIESNYFGGGYEIVRKDDRYGILNASGEIVVPIVFRAIYSGFKLDDGTYFWSVEDENNVRGYIDKDGSKFWE